MLQAVKAAAAVVGLLSALWVMELRIESEIEKAVERGITAYEIKFASLDTDVDECRRRFVGVIYYHDLVLWASRLRNTSHHDVPEPEIRSTIGP